MDPDEQRVMKYLESYELTCDVFTKDEKKTGKTPDLRVNRNSSLVFYCEVKSSKKDRWLDEQLETTAPGEVAGGLRNDPIFNRLTNDIHTAIKQFNAVNPNQDKPNVLALVNHDKNCGFNDLIETVTGNFYSDDGGIHPISKRYSEGRIREEKE